jgi:hypothetical protein
MEEKKNKNEHKNTLPHMWSYFQYIQNVLLKGGGDEKRCASSSAPARHYVPGSTDPTLRGGGVEVVLDPMTTVMRLITLKEHPFFTKMGVEGCSLRLDQPSKLQGTKRWFAGSSRNDICHLRQAIQRFTQLYNMKHPLIAGLARSAIEGLDHFSKCYSSTDLATTSIAYYQLVIRSAIAENKTTATVVSSSTTAPPVSDTTTTPAKPHQVVVCEAATTAEKKQSKKKQPDFATTTISSVSNSMSSSSSSSSVSNIFSNTSVSDDEDKVLLNFLKQMWTLEQISLIVQNLNQLGQPPGEPHSIPSEFLLAAIDSILSAKDKKLEEFQRKQQHVYVQPQPEPKTTRAGVPVPCSGDDDEDFAPADPFS